jgi:hypothetical protein
MPVTAPRARSRQPKQLDAGIFQAEINSFALRLAAEGKAAKAIRTYTEAVQWFAAAGLQAGRGGWEQVTSGDIQQWMAWLLGRYAPPTPAASTGPCSSSSNGRPPRTSCPTRWPGWRRRA